jgi:hypothetical protein
VKCRSVYLEYLSGTIVFSTEPKSERAIAKC